MPADAEATDSLVAQAARHPGSDAASSARRADGRRVDDPIGMHDDDQHARPTADTPRGN